MGITTDEVMALQVLPKATIEAIVNLASNATALTGLAENAEALGELAESSESLLALLETETPAEEPSSEGGGE